jgi:hypothetical protein
MRLILLLLSIIIPFNIIYCQKFDGYKYVTVTTLTYQNGGTDIYRISETLRQNFTKKGFIVISEDNKNWPKEAKADPCLIINCYPFHKGASIAGFTIKNCKNEIIFDEKSNSTDLVGNYQNNFDRALRNCWNRFNQYSYRFDGIKTPVLELPAVEKTDETESALIYYFDNNPLDELEGIYKSYQTGAVSIYYKFGIKKYGYIYKAIIIEADYKQWKTGEVKATFEPTSINNFYSTTWYMGDKTPFETFSKIDKEALLSIDVTDPSTGEKRQDKYIKIYPLSSANNAIDRNRLGVVQNNSAQNQNIKETFYSSSTIVDVDVNIPEVNEESENTFVVIIANENYQKEVNVLYAANDGKVFREYCNKTLGIPSKNIHLVTDASYGNIKSEIKWISDVAFAYNGKAKLIFYYAGHGMPDETDKSAYLLPVDGISTDFETAIKLDDLYNRITSNPAQSVSVFLDACFSGSIRDEGMLANARSVKIKPKENIVSGNIVVFSAASGDETAYPYDDKHHGLFTYFLLKKLQETKGDVNFGDLADYLISNVNQQSIVINQKTQTPQINVSSSLRESWQQLKLK